MKTFFAIIGWVVAIPILGMLWFGGAFEKSPEQQAAADFTSFQSSARASCVTALRRQLHNPRSAEWVNRTAWPIARYEDGNYQVRATFRAENALGGTVTQSADCVIRRDGRDAFVIRID